MGLPDDRSLARRTRGENPRQIHALTESACQPLAFLLTGGNVETCTPADTSADHMPNTPILDCGKSFDSRTALRNIHDTRATPSIPPKVIGAERAACHPSHIASATPSGAYSDATGT